MHTAVHHKIEGFGIRQGFDQPHTVVEPEKIAGGRQGIGVHGRGRNDCHACYLTVRGISRGGVQQMMVERAVFIEAALIDAGSDHGGIRQADDSRRFALGGKRFLDAESVGLAIWLRPDDQQIGPD